MKRVLTLIIAGTTLLQTLVDGLQFTVVKSMALDGAVAFAEFNDSTAMQTTRCMSLCQRAVYETCRTAAVERNKVCKLFSEDARETEWVTSEVSALIFPLLEFSVTTQSKIVGATVLQNTVFKGISNKLCGLKCSMNRNCVAAQIHVAKNTCELLGTKPPTYGVSWERDVKSRVLIGQGGDDQSYLVAYDMTANLDYTVTDTTDYGGSAANCMKSCNADSSCMGIEADSMFEECYMSYVDFMDPSIPWEPLVGNVLLLKSFNPPIFEDSSQIYSLIFAAYAGAGTRAMNKWNDDTASDDDPNLVLSMNPACFKVDNNLNCKQHIRTTEIESTNWTEVPSVKLKVVGPGPDENSLYFNSPSSHSKAWFSSRGLWGPWDGMDESEPVLKLWGQIRGKESFSITTSDDTTCATSAGWLLVIDADDHPCKKQWGLENTTFPIILHSNGSGPVVWASGLAAKADILAVYLQHW